VNPLARCLLDAGLIQFGWFRRGDTTLPFSINLDMLASYPGILNQAAEAAQEITEAQEVTRLLCTVDAIPFGVAVSQRTGIPLVYSRGVGEAPVFDLVGAYDIGHPTLLLTNSVEWNESLFALVKGARQVGLEVHTMVVILEIHPGESDVAVIPLLRLADVVRDMDAEGQLPQNQVQVVLQSLNF
jgi:orotate phosphoribosyltransferase